MPVLKECVPWDRVNNVLDIGSNRGDFVKWVRSMRGDAQIVGIEPDSSIVEGYRALPGLKLIVDRAENVELPDETFDLVYCSHTLEHADSAEAMLRQINACLKTGGFLFLEVPNVEVLVAPDCVEEFFIDKHRFHFSRALLASFLSHMGLSVVRGDDDDDSSNITFVAVKESAPSSNSFRGGLVDVPQTIAGFIRNYLETLASNRRLLVVAAAKLHSFARRQKVAYWGAGRILDALVRYGGLDLAGSWGVVDEYLWNILPTVHGVTVRRTEELKINPPDVIVVLARGSAEEIVRKARRLGIRKTIVFADLLLGAA